ncbi:hypothetical protein [Aminobacter niigataensis]|uniref:hypothetical protein n=1 Tax=Aminobacter niigataensis TaxID=83265 RepID=UPI00298F2A67|nr:hypothetical protein [Aminobacter niigataensis]
MADDVKKIYGKSEIVETYSWVVALVEVQPVSGDWLFRLATTGRRTWPIVVQGLW